MEIRKRTDSKRTRHGFFQGVIIIMASKIHVPYFTIWLCYSARFQFRLLANSISLKQIQHVLNSACPLLHSFQTNSACFKFSLFQIRLVLNSACFKFGLFQIRHGRKDRYRIPDGRIPDRRILDRRIPDKRIPERRINLVLIEKYTKLSKDILVI